MNMSKLVRENGPRLAGLVAVLLSLSLFACQAPFGANQAQGQGSLALGLPQARSTAYEAITSWQISAQGPDASIDRTIDASAEEVVFEELVVGTWTFTIEGYDAHSTMLYQVTKDVEIAAGENTADFVLEMVNGVLLGHWNYDGGSTDDLTGRNVVTPGLIGPAPSMPPMVYSNQSGQTVQGDGYVTFVPAYGTTQETQGAIVDLGAVNFGPKFTLSCWLKPTLSGSYANSKQVILSNQNGSTVAGGYSNGSGFTLSINTYGQTADNTVHFTTSNGTGSSSEVISSPLNSDLWNHVAVSVDRTAGTATIYVNGTPTNGSVVTDFAVRDANARVAAFPDADYDLGIAGCFYNGSMDDWRIYTGALGPDDIKLLFGGIAFAGGSGTAADPFLVATPQHLSSVRNFPAAWFSQSESIALGTGDWTIWNPIGMSGVPFSGHYNGNNFDISGLRMPATNSWYNNFGLFGYLNNAAINNVHLSGVDITCLGSSSPRAALAAQATASTITLCSATGTIQAGGDVGGLVGKAIDSSISRCFANVAINAGSDTCNAGGLVGNHISTGPAATITDSYAQGAVAAGIGIGGGLLGANDGTAASVQKCYATGLVSVTTGTAGGFAGSNTAGSIGSNCFWDTITTGQGASAGGGTGQSTALMQTASTYTNAGWDSTTVWDIPGSSYPTLR